MKKDKREKKVAEVNMPIDGNDPAVCVKALVKIAEAMCDTLGLERTQGALHLMSAAAFIVDSECARWSKEKGEEPSGRATMNAYMHSAMAAWNGFLVMFKDVDPKAAGMVGMSLVGLEDEETPTRRKGETLQ